MRTPASMRTPAVRSHFMHARSPHAHTQRPPLPKAEGPLPAIMRRWCAASAAPSPSDGQCSGLWLLGWRSPLPSPAPTLPYTTDAQVVRRICRSIAFRQLVVIAVAIFLVRFALNSVLRLLARWSSSPVAWDKSRMYYVMKEVGGLASKGCPRVAWVCWGVRRIATAQTQLPLPISAVLQGPAAAPQQVALRRPSPLTPPPPSLPFAGVLSAGAAAVHCRLLHHRRQLCAAAHQRAKGVCGAAGEGLRFALWRCSGGCSAAGTGL